MAMNAFDYAVFIGRFQPAHHGHFHVISQALKQADHLIIVIGSHMRARDAARLPFNTDERIAMLKAGIPMKDIDRVTFVPIEDYRYNFARWLTAVQHAVSGVQAAHGWRAGPTTTCLVGHSKDSTSFYLNNFPQWGSIQVANFGGLSATNLRNELLGSLANGDIDITRNPNITDDMPGETVDMLDNIVQGGALDDMVEEYDVLRKYWRSWEAAPFPPVFVTTDAAVTQSGHILMITRRSAPGKNNLALPGGFLNRGELIRDGIIRELNEETKLAVPRPVIDGSIAKIEVFDDPYRSARGRTITHAALIKLRDDIKMPKVKGSDDAAKAFWMPFAELKDRRNECFDDHYDIIETLVGGI